MGSLIIIWFQPQYQLLLKAFFALFEFLFAYIFRISGHDFEHAHVHHIQMYQ